jgi:hypothetical protein
VMDVLVEIPYGVLERNLYKKGTIYLLSSAAMETRVRCKKFQEKSFDLFSPRIEILKFR